MTRLEKILKPHSAQLQHIKIFNHNQNINKISTKKNTKIWDFLLFFFLLLLKTSQLQKVNLR